MLDPTREAWYLVEGQFIVAYQRIPFPAQQEVVTIRRILWFAARNYNVALLAALILASPGWTWHQRSRALGWSLGLLFLTQLAFLVVHNWYMPLQAFTTKYGPLLPPGYSQAKAILLRWLWAFLVSMGHGYFALLFYWGALAFTWGCPGKGPPSPRRRPQRSVPLWQRAEGQAVLRRLRRGSRPI